MNLLLLSGPIAVGKSSIAKELIDSLGFKSIRTSIYLKGLAAKQGMEATRANLQELGDRLDEETDFYWVLRDVAVPQMNESPESRRWLFDCVRKKRQVEHFMAAFSTKALHVHLLASEATLRERYEARIRLGGDYVGNLAYEMAIQHPNEIASRSLKDTAHVVLNVDGRSCYQVAEDILAHMRDAK